MAHKEDETTIRINLALHSELIKFIGKYEEKHGIEISMPKATKIIGNKIKALGGFTVS